MTVAPELKNMRELALYCISQGIILQAGHTNASYEQMIEGMQVKIMHLTHMFNAMRPLHHRDPAWSARGCIHQELSCGIHRRRGSYQSEIDYPLYAEQAD